jgi:hypothetical protein
MGNVEKEKERKESWMRFRCRWINKKIQREKLCNGILVKNAQNKRMIFALDKVMHPWAVMWKYYIYLFKLKKKNIYPGLEINVPNRRHQNVKIRIIQ